MSCFGGSGSNQVSRMPYRVLLCLFILPISLSAGPRHAFEHQAADSQVAGAPAPPQGAQPIRIATNLVQVPVSVTDRAGSPVKNLQKDDFRIEENGAAVNIEHMGEPGETRLDMVLVFDVTGSTRARFDFEQLAATHFLKTVFRPKDEVAILTIASAPTVVLGRTTVLATALEGLGQLKPSGAATPFYDSVIAAARILRILPDPETRRVQIVLSDGEDNRSEHPLADAMKEVQQADCIFYSINPGGQSIRLNKVSLRGQQGMEALATQTGGSAFLADRMEDLEQIYGRIASELQAQYLLSYYSPDPRMDGSFRSIVVRVPQKPELRVRSRQGYYSAAGTNSSLTPDKPAQPIR